MSYMCHRVRLPRIAADAEPEPADRAGIAEQALVVDHDADYGMVVADVLSRSCGVRLTSSDRTAFRLLSTGPHALVVVEYTFPDALDLVRRIRTGWPATSVVMLSRTPLLAREIVECFEADIDDYLPSPFHPSELAARVSRVRRRSAPNPPSVGSVPMCERCGYEEGLIARRPGSRA